MANKAMCQHGKHTDYFVFPIALFPILPQLPRMRMESMAIVIRAMAVSGRHAKEMARMTMEISGKFTFFYSTSFLSGRYINGMANMVMDVVASTSTLRSLSQLPYSQHSPSCPCGW